MIFESAKQLKAFPPSTWVKVDATLIGIGEVKYAEAWTIGVTKTGNLVGLGESELITTTPEELKKESHPLKNFPNSMALILRLLASQKYCLFLTKLNKE